ncbi:MAG TPA: alpha/beta fold hydrolase [Bryobacteraceae bacterium]|jgi:dipeptidyl aminopeptidase/acylaminoacyl peptidase|nr:alpha/beta fold hydrolase [Bryobacteraceae bacterium]
MKTYPAASLLLLLGVLVSAQKKSSGLPPLIDRELFFGNPEIAGAQISPDGKYIAFLKPWNDTRNVWVKKTEEPFSTARRLTAEAKRPIAGYLWSRDSKYILYVKDNDGDENFNVHAVDPSGPGVPESRDLTGLKGVRVELFSAPKSDPDALYIGLNDRDKAWHDLYKLKISTGERTLIRKNTERISGWDFDLTGQLRLAGRVLDNGDQEILRVDASGFTPIFTCNVFETCSVERFHKDGKRAYIQTNKGDGTNLTALGLIDPATGKVDVVESDPLKRVDFESARFSEATDELVATVYTDDRQRVYFKDKSFEADHRFLEGKLPGRELSIASTTLDDRLWLVVAYGDTEPGETYLFDRKGRTLALQYTVREKLPRAALGPMKAVRYKSSDGLEIPAYLTLPKGVPEKNLPAVVIPHGGPWARDYWGFNSLAQFFANRGYVVLMPNFRGSTGYGKNFLNAGNGEWGRKMQDDVTWGVKYLIAEGIADPKRIGILGGSYGGYATLAGVAFTPDVYRAGVDIVGPSNLLTLLEAIPPYWEAGRKMMYARMADPGTPQGKAWMEERSPLNSANKIKTPLFVVQGANDPRVNRREAEQIVVALRDRGFPVEYMLAPDEGHGFQRPVNNMAMFMEAEKFLATYLDGRYQDRGTPEVEARLKEIMVDPKTVKVSKVVDAGAVSAPKPVADLAAGVDHYEVKLAMGGQEMTLKLSTAIAEENGQWVATETLDTPMGAMTDVSTIEKGTLVLRKRSVKQGPATIGVEFSGNQASGTMSMNGQDRAISADMGGPLFADAGAAAYSIACLPLADGYTTSFRNFDLQKQKVKLMQLSVAGSETVTVPAGTFSVFRVEVSSADGGADKSTMWIAKDSRKPVKISSVMASMGGAVMTAELGR